MGARIIRSKSAGGVVRHPMPPNTERTPNNAFSRKSSHTCSIGMLAGSFECGNVTSPAMRLTTSSRRILGSGMGFAFVFASTAASGIRPGCSGLRLIRAAIWGQSSHIASETKASRKAHSQDHAPSNQCTRRSPIWARTNSQLQSHALLGTRVAARKMPPRISRLAISRPP
jgi:hypothetical protein